jgi:hypothetical protein
MCHHPLLTELCDLYEQKCLNQLSRGDAQMCKLSKSFRNCASIVSTVSPPVYLGGCSECRCLLTDIIVCLHPVSKIERQFLHSRLCSLPEHFPESFVYPSPPQFCKFCYDVLVIPYFFSKWKARRSLPEFCQRNISVLSLTSFSETLLFPYHTKHGGCMNNDEFIITSKPLTVLIGSENDL